MYTYYLSFHCVPKPGHKNSRDYSGSLADLFITAESEDGVEERAAEYLDVNGWSVGSLEYAELVPHPSTHDMRFNKLWQSAQTDGLAGLLSPYAA